MNESISYADSKIDRVLMKVILVCIKFFVILFFTGSKKASHDECEIVVKN